MTEETQRGTTEPQLDLEKEAALFFMSKKENMNNSLYSIVVFMTL